ncbi:trigger factor [Anaerolineae bacterium CFX9]|nr:trigger factor [Anaerolineae bacterium CFX9]
MNIQSERLENHTMRLTVEVEPERLQNFMQQAARKLSSKVNIPGFRKGKAPYSIMVRYLGEDYIRDEAVELLSNDIYKQALIEQEIDPYGPGALDDVSYDPALTLTFSVPLQPTVDLGDYRSVRVDYAPPAVEDDAVDRAMRTLQEQNAVVEESRTAAVLGDRVTLALHSVFVEEGAEADAEAEENTEAEAEAETEHHDEHDHDHESEDHGHDHDHEGHEHSHGDLAIDKVMNRMKGETFMHEHAYTLILDAEHEPVKGFAEAVAGIEVGGSKEFDLVIPEDDPEYDDIAGKTIRFHVIADKIEKVTLPAMNDDFAARVTADEEKPLTLLELRMRVRENLENAARNRYESEYARQALDAITEQADIRYPEAMVIDETERFLQNLDGNLRQQGLNLDTYMKLTRKTREQLHEEYRDTAIQSLRRSLVMGEVMIAEQIAVNDDDINAEIDRVAAQFEPERQDEIRALFRDQNMRASIATDVLNNRVRERIALIARGEAPEPSAAEEAAPEASNADDEQPSTDVATEVTEEKGD